MLTPTTPSTKRLLSHPKLDSPKKPSALNRISAAMVMTTTPALLFPRKVVEDIKIQTPCCF